MIVEMPDPALLDQMIAAAISHIEAHAAVGVTLACAWPPNVTRS